MSLCVAVVGQTTEPGVVNLENDVHAMRQLLASIRDMQHHTSEAVFYIGHVAAALYDCKDTAAVAEAQMQEDTQRGLAANSAPELLGSAEAGTHILAKTHAALQRVVAELTRACA